MKAHNYVRFSATMDLKLQNSLHWNSTGVGSLLPFWEFTNGDQPIWHGGGFFTNWATETNAVTSLSPGWIFPHWNPNWGSPAMQGFFTNWAIGEPCFWLQRPFPEARISHLLCCLQESQVVFCCCFFFPLSGNSLGFINWDWATSYP